MGQHHQAGTAMQSQKAVYAYLNVSTLSQQTGECLALIMMRYMIPRPYLNPGQASPSCPSVEVALGLHHRLWAIIYATLDQNQWRMAYTSIMTVFSVGRGGGAGAVVKAACLERRISRARIPQWNSGFKETKCFFPTHS